MVTKDIIEEYTKYIDPSEMIIEYYKNQATAGLEKYFLQIEDWLASDVPADKNKPLIIQADEGVGKKTLLVQWMKYHQQKSKKTFPDLIISHFAGTEGNNENYFYAIYKILVRLREHFDISQKVELLEDKLEGYFHYWLGVCSRALIGKIVDDSNIILVFEGINLFRDPDTKEEANVGLWLPKSFPDRIRVIITVEPGTLATKHFDALGCEVISIDNEAKLPSTLINNVVSRPSFIIDETYKQRVVQILNSKSPEVLRNSLFIKTFLSTLLPYPSDHLIKETDINKEEFKALFQKMDFKKLESLSDINELNMFLLDYFSSIITDLDKFRGIMVALNITEKGLSEMEIFTLTGATPKEWNYILTIFKTFMMKYKDLWKINNETFKKAIRAKFQEDPGYATQLHNDIAEILNKKTSNSIRKLEEETYHLFMSKNYFKLKEAVANIENFLLLFNPNNKYDLCRYWQILEQRGFDPASEYTKAVEGFELHYRPSQEDTFMIILQVSRFLKEFSDFETHFTPQFRHPPLRGGTELKEIGLRREIKKLAMYQPEEWEPEDDQVDELDELEHKLTKEFPDYPDTTIKEMVQQIHSATQSQKKVEQSMTTKPTEGETKPGEEAAQSSEKKSGKLKSLVPSGGRERKANELFLLNPIEALNVDIPDNREKFKAYIMGRLDETKRAATAAKENKEKENKEAKGKKMLDEDEAPVEQPNDTVIEQRANFKKNKMGSRLVSAAEEKRESVNKEAVVPVKKSTNKVGNEEARVDVEPTFYYYKRWLWMMFPWVCLSSKKDFNFSKIIYECFSSATEYMSVANEREKTRQALKIAIEAKLKKQSVYAPKDMSQLTTTRFNRNDSLGKSNKKILPPITAGRPSQIASPDGLNTSSNKSTIRLDTLSPVHGRPIKRLMPNSTSHKDANFFVTNEVLTPHYLNDTNVTGAEPSLIGKVSPTINTTLQSISALNRSGNPAREKSMSNIVTNRKVEEMLRNANEVIQAMLLPKYQDSLLVTSTKQIDDLEGKIKLLQSQFDELAYLSKMAAKKLKDLSVIEGNLKAEGVAEAVIKAQTRLDELTAEIAKAEKMKADAISQGERLSKIILVCVKNKSQNVLGVQSLNYLLNNLRKMIIWEKEDATENAKNALELEKLLKQYIKVFDERLKQQERVVKHIRHEKMASVNIERRLETGAFDNLQFYDSLEQTAIMTNETLKTKQKMQKEAQEKKMKTEMMKERAKNAKENVEEMRQMYEQIEKTIGLDFESAQFIGFLDYIEKINDFQKSLYESENEIEKLKEEYKSLSSYLETLKKAKGGEKKVEEKEKAAYMELNDKDQLTKILQDKRKNNDGFGREVGKRTELVLNSKMVLSKICRELGIQFEDKSIDQVELPTETILSKVGDMMKAIKEAIPPEEYEKFQKGGVDMNKKYKEHKGDFEINKKFTMEGEENSAGGNVFRKGAKIIESKHE